MSKATSCILDVSSKISPPLIKIPLFAARLVPIRTAVGVAKPKAQGQATTSTLLASYNPVNSAYENPLDNNLGKSLGPTKVQKARVPRDMHMIDTVSFPEIWSA